MKVRRYRSIGDGLLDRLLGEQHHSLPVTGSITPAPLGHFYRIQSSLDAVQCMCVRACVQAGRICLRSDSLTCQAWAMQRRRKIDRSAGEERVDGIRVEGDEKGSLICDTGHSLRLPARGRVHRYCYRSVV